MAENYFGLKDTRGQSEVIYNVTPLSIALAFSISTAYKKGQYCFYQGTLYRFTADKAAGAWNSSVVELANIGEDLISVSEVSNLFSENIPDTTATVVFGSGGKPAIITHTKNNTAVRTDEFVWSDNSVTETRTLASGKYITITTNLNTLVQSISAIQETA